MHKVLLFGSTGKLGSRVLSKLADSESYSIGLFLKAGQSSNKHNSGKVRIFNGNILNVNNIEESIKWADIVINCTGKVSYKKKDRKDIYLTNYIGTKNILEACEKYNKNLIHTSSAAVYGYSQNAIPFKESDVSSDRVAKVNSMYYTSKFDSDMMVLCSNITKIVLRPSSFIAREKSTLKVLYSLIIKRFFPLLGGGASFVLIDDVAKAYIKAIELMLKNNQVSYVFNLGGNNLSFKEVLEIFNKQTNKWCFKVPYLFLILIGYINDYILEPLHKGIGVTSESVRLANRYCYIDSDRAKQVLDYKITPIEECLTEII